MNRKIIIFGVALLLSLRSFGQGSSERAAFKNILRGKWDKAYTRLTKSMQKDTASSGAAYVMAYYFFSPENPNFDIDSAHHYIGRAQRDFLLLSDKDRDKLERNAVDSVSLRLLSSRIDSAAFQRAKDLNSEDGFISFLQEYSTSDFVVEAADLRNEAAYQSAVSANTYEAFRDFITKYPGATRVPDAQAQYDALLYRAKTSDGKLASYELYLRETPLSPYKREVEEAIFQIRTASGTADAYVDYLQNHSSQYFVRKATNILFYLIPEDRRENELERFLTDSLRTAIQVSKGYLVPFLHDGKFGFMNQDGKEIMSASERDIEPDYVCGGITDDVVVLPGRLLTPDGQDIVNEEVQSIEEIGAGFLLVENDSCSKVMHKSGFFVGDGVDDARVISDQFLALRINGRWSIWTFNGRQLLPPEWDDITSIMDVIALKQDGMVRLATVQMLTGVADRNPLTLTDPVDEVKLWRNRWLWVRRDEQEGLLDGELKSIVALAPRHLAPTYFGTTSTTAEGVTTFNEGGHESQVFQQVQIRQPWTAVKLDSVWVLYDPSTRSFVSQAFDSISFDGLVPFGIRKDSAWFYFTPSKFLAVAAPYRSSFVPGQDSTAYLMVDVGGKKTLYSLKGKRQFEVPFDRVEYAGEGLFAVYKKDKKGLINSVGKVILKPEYDAIGTATGGVVTLLKNGRFGMYDGARNKLIKPQYDKNVAQYNAQYNVVYKDGKYGFADWSNKTLDKPGFEEVRFWNDTSALVRVDYVWKVYDLKTRRILLDNIRKLLPIRESGTERLYILQQGHNYGVIHNRDGIIIPLSFSDVINVGTQEVPLYFTEKHVEEASLFVVIYYDANGKMIRKEVHEQDDYDRIYCAK